MELRDLTYFLAIAQEGGISAAARRLHLTQPALTRQLKALEANLGRQLVIRGTHSITLTEEGMLLRKRAEEILGLVDRTEYEIRNADENISGDLYICSGETDAVRYLARAMHHLRQSSPGLRFHISSGDTIDVTERLDRGLADFGLLFCPLNASQYESLPIPYYDTWGVLMRKDSPLAQQETVCAANLLHEPLIMPRGEYIFSQLISRLFSGRADNLVIAATYSLLVNASLMVSEGVGYALGLDGILNLTGDSDLCFRPWAPLTQMQVSLVWKRSQFMSRASRAFLKEMQAQSISLEM